MSQIVYRNYAQSEGKVNSFFIELEKHFRGTVKHESVLDIISLHGLGDPVYPINYAATVNFGHIIPYQLMPQKM